MHSTNNTKPFYKIICIILIVITAFSLTGCTHYTKTLTTKIDNLEWTATAEIQEYKLCDESGWEIPEGATVYKEQEEIKSYEIVGYTTKYKTEEYQEIVGYFPHIWRPIYRTKTRQIPYKEPIKEPVYATKYYYKINKYMHVKNIRLGSGNSHNYTYPEYICEENQKIGEIKYKFLIYYTIENKEICETINKGKWEQLQIGQEIPVKKNQYGDTYVDWNDVCKNTPAIPKN